MNTIKKIEGLVSKKDFCQLKAGEEIFFSGIVYTARDQAHKKLVELIKKDKKIPFEINNSIIYYCGPTQTPKGKIIGSCGPTTSNRMDNFVEPLLQKGLIGMIGKGRRSKQVRNLLRRYKAVYFLAPSGCGALLAKKVLSKNIVCFEELGPEAVYKLEVRDFPLIVGIDCEGSSLYEDL